MWRAVVTFVYYATVNCTGPAATEPPLVYGVTQSSSDGIKINNSDLVLPVIGNDTVFLGTPSTLGDINQTLQEVAVHPQIAVTFDTPPTCLQNLSREFYGSVFGLHVTGDVFSIKVDLAPETVEHNIGNHTHCSDDDDCYYSHGVSYVFVLTLLIFL